MIKYKNYDAVIANAHKYKQDHVFEYWDKLSEDEKNILLKDMSCIDFDLIAGLFAKRFNNQRTQDYKPAMCIPIPASEDDKAVFARAEETGRKYIASGKAAALMVAGGQGTRLGFDGPKGKFSIGPVSGKSLFQMHAEKIIFSSKKHKTNIPWLIMTSKENPINYFEKNNYFGINEKNLFFFRQNEIPSLDINGKLILKSKCSISMNPDGHGGVLNALSTSGLLKMLKDRGIESVSYFQVDNPLINIIDPIFFGFHVLNRSDASSKAVDKAGPDEKVGVFVEFQDAGTGIIEYSDMSSENKTAKDGNGRLIFRLGNIAAHIFQISFIEEILKQSNVSLPYHQANKKIKAMVNGTIKEIDCIKFEKFIFDSLSYTKNNTILEVSREADFAPVKNASGVDSPETAKKLISSLHRRWIIERKIHIPDTVKVIEISPLAGLNVYDISKDVLIPDQENVYIE